jgi:hypothetical protein
LYYTITESMSPTLLSAYPYASSVPELPPEIWIEVMDYLELEDIWLRIRRCCLLFHAISTEIAHRHVALRINNLCSVHTGNALSLSTPHFHWQGQDSNVSTHLNHVTWSELPEDQHPDIFLVPAEEIPTCFSLYLARDMSWTYTLRIIFRRAEVSDDGVEKWVADSEGGWEMHYGTIKGPVQQGVPPERALKWRRVCPTKLVVPLAGLVRMLLLGPDQGY